MSELKACPWCSSTSIEPPDRVFEWATCKSCSAKGPWGDDHDGTKWNTRPESPEVQQLRERVRVLEAVREAARIYRICETNALFRNLFPGGDKKQAQVLDAALSAAKGDGK